MTNVTDVFEALKYIAQSQVTGRATIITIRANCTVKTALR